MLNANLFSVVDVKNYCRASACLYLACVSVCVWHLRRGRWWVKVFLTPHLYGTGVFFCLRPRLVLVVISPCFWVSEMAQREWEVRENSRPSSSSSLSTSHRPQPSLESIRTSLRRGADPWPHPFRLKCAQRFRLNDGKRQNCVVM